MDLPFIGPKKEKIEELEAEIERLREEIEELEDDKESFRNRFESEKERRSKLSAEKQKAEKELKKLRQKMDNAETEEPEHESQQFSGDFQDLKLKEAKSIIQKLSKVKSEERDLVTVFSKEKISEIDDFRGLKNTLNSDQLELIDKKTSLTAFLDEELFEVLIGCRPFSQSDWVLDDSFRVERLQQFIEEEKTWIIVSAGDSMIVKEANGRIENRIEVKTRVDRKHTQGGFSQKRFERKREEQLEEHLDALRDKLPDGEKLLVGDRALCKKIDGEYMGGFDDNRSLIDALYGFQIYHEHG